MEASEDTKEAGILGLPRLSPRNGASRSGLEPAATFALPDALAVLDWVAALGLLLLALPVLMLALLWVFLLDRRNPLFSQVRIGLGGRPFRIYKIRTMSHFGHGVARFCAHGDERILPGARFLRKTRIDEIPQLFNVLKGDMALVGPRPEQPFFVETFLREIPGYGERFKVKPGITGLAQVTQGYVDSTNGTRIKLGYDLEFIRNRSIRIWCRIILATIRVVVFGYGAR